MSISFGGLGQARKPKFSINEHVHIIANKQESVIFPNNSHRSTAASNNPTINPGDSHHITFPELIPKITWQINSIEYSNTITRPHRYTLVPVKQPQITVPEHQLVAARFVPGDIVVFTEAASGGSVYRILETKIVLIDGRMCLRHRLENEVGTKEDNVPEENLRLANAEKGEVFWPV